MGVTCSESINHNHSAKYSCVVTHQQSGLNLQPPDDKSHQASSQKFRQLMNQLHLHSWSKTMVICVCTLYIYIYIYIYTHIHTHTASSKSSKNENNTDISVYQIYLWKLHEKILRHYFLKKSLLASMMAFRQLLNFLQVFFNGFLV